MDLKILVKVWDEGLKVWKWCHFCYTDKATYEKFTEVEDLEGGINKALSRWALKDFDIESYMNTTEDICKLKQAVRDHYKATYPEVFLETETDRQGWLRVWFTEKLKEEIEAYGK